jgi:hypothetical protein
MGAVKGDCGGDIDIRDPITISHAKIRLILQQMSHAGQPPACLGIFARVNQRHAPRLGGGAQNLRRARGQINRQI